MKILNYLLKQLKFFIINPFWTKVPILGIIIISLVINGLIWFFYLTKYREMVNITPIYYSSAVLILNLLLGNIIFQKQPLMTYLFLGTSVLIQIFILYFLLLNNVLGGF